MAGCPSQEAFKAEVTSRTPRARMGASGEDVRQFVVQFERRDDRVEGRLVVRTGNHRGPTRTVEGATCAEAASALALIIAVAVDPLASTAPADQLSRPTARQSGTGLPVSNRTAKNTPDVLRMAVAASQSVIEAYLTPPDVVTAKVERGRFYTGAELRSLHDEREVFKTATKLSKAGAKAQQIEVSARGRVGAWRVARGTCMRVRVPLCVPRCTRMPPRGKRARAKRWLRPLRRPRRASTTCALYVRRSGTVMQRGWSVRCARRGGCARRWRGELLLTVGHHESVRARPAASTSRRLRSARLMPHPRRGPARRIKSVPEMIYLAEKIQII